MGKGNHCEKRNRALAIVRARDNKFWFFLLHLARECDGFFSQEKNSAAKGCNRSCSFTTVPRHAAGTEQTVDIRSWKDHSAATISILKSSHRKFTDSISALLRSSQSITYSNVTVNVLYLCPWTSTCIFNRAEALRSLISTVHRISLDQLLT